MLHELLKKISGCNVLKSQIKKINFSIAKSHLKFFYSRWRHGPGFLDKQSEMIIFESILTTFEASVVFEAAETVEGIDSSL